MIENKETNSIKESHSNFDQGRYLENQQKQERRIEPSEGYTYITTVGWIDRREMLRRKAGFQAF
jgi:hypothetical protein